MIRPVLLLAFLALSLCAAPAAIAAAQEHAPPAAAADEVPHDTGHAASAGHEEPNPIQPPMKGIITSVSTLLVFGGLVFILGRYAWGPIVAGLKSREGKIRAEIEAAEQARAEADAVRRQFEEQLATAEGRVREMLARAQADGQQLAARIRIQAQQEAEDVKQKAIREIEQSQRKAVEEIRAHAATLATSVAEKILRREVNRDDQRRLVEASLDEFQAVESGS